MMLNDIIQQVLVEQGLGPIYGRVAMTEGAQGVCLWARKQVHDLIAVKALLAVGYRIVIEQLQYLESPPTPAMMMKMTINIPAYINRSFPGYAKAGLLGLIVGQRRNRNAK
ncbi:MAG: hypothetical protein L0287_01390 [Anaerolineae bacterium]|nr:hypothetical protein [Anaerolineae bacterium]